MSQQPGWSHAHPHGERTSHYVRADRLAQCGIGVYGGETFPAPPQGVTACQDCLDDPAVPLPVPQRGET